VRRYILTGAPGSGKTAILRQLEVAGHAVVEEAATDVIALHQALGDPEPWQDPAFIDHIVDLQRKRQLTAEQVHTAVTFFDRSPVCTLALSRYAAATASAGLLAEINRMHVEHLYERTVFFIRSQGYVQPTAARRISFEDSLVFEQVHELTYRELGFELIEVPPAPLKARAALVQKAIDSPQQPS